MEATLFADLTKRTLSTTPGGSSFQFPALVQGETISLGLRFTETIADAAVEVTRTANALKATIGKLDARPERGTFKLTIGPDSPSGANTTTALDCKCTPKQAETAINALTDIVADYGSAVVSSHEGSFLIKFGTGSEEVEIAATFNDLFPVSFVRVRAYANNEDQWIHEVRLSQAPVAFTNTSEIVVPPPPVITRLQAGGSNVDASWNEIQKLAIPANFAGTYQIRRGYAKTILLSTADGADEIAAALAEIAGEDEEFVVTNPSNFTIHIEFSGEAFEGLEQDLLTVQVFDAPVGDLTFDLALDSYELATVLRAAKEGEVRLPIEIEASLEDEADDEVVRPVVLYRGEVLIKRQLGGPEIAEAQNRDWLRGPKRRNYIPYTDDQVITGVQHYTTTMGNGVATSFTIDHNLSTEAIHVTVRENEASGSLLVLGTDYTVTVVDEDSLTIAILTGNPRANASLAAIISSAGPVSAFQAHTHTIEQIVNLRTELDALGASIAALEGLIPAGAAAVAAAAATDVVASWTLPNIFEVFPARVPVTGSSDKALSAIDLKALSRASGLYPAIHDASAENVSSLPSTFPLPSATYKGKVYINNTAGNVTAPAGGGTRGHVIKPGEHVGCDGRYWYKVGKYDPTSQTTWYPSSFERELFTLFVDAKQLRLKKKFALGFGLELAVLNANTRAQWSVIVQVGTATQETSPATTGRNLKAITWVDAPLLEQPIIVTPVPSSHSFGVNISRALVAAVDTISAEKILYGNTEVATPPASATFAIRAILGRFDVEDSEENQRGFVAVRGLKVSAAPDTTEGIATIK